MIDNVIFGRSELTVRLRE